MQSQSNDHWDAVMQILKAHVQELLYEDNGNTQIVGCSNADWVGSPIDRQSTLGYCDFIGGDLVSWRSNNQNVAA